MAIFEWYASLSPVFRFGVALLFIAISTVLWFTGTFWPWGWGAGIVLLCFAFPSRAEQKGYHDF